MAKTQPASAGGQATAPLEALLALHEVALDTMAHGLCMFDADYRVVLFNRRYLEIFNMSPDVIRRGLHFRDVLAHSAERGNFRPDKLDLMWEERRDMLQRGKPFSLQQRLADGTTIAFHFRPMADGGWVSVYEDVTPSVSSSGRCASRSSGSIRRSATCRTGCACSTARSGWSSATRNICRCTISMPRW